MANSHSTVATQYIPIRTFTSMVDENTYRLYGCEKENVHEIENIVGEVVRAMRQYVR